MSDINYQKQFPNIRTAKSSDNQAILDFLKTTNMHNKKLVLRYNREPNFFSFLKSQGNSYLVYLLLDKDKLSIKGLAVLSIREAYVNGKLTKVVYLSDLRIASQVWRGARLQWKKFYSFLLKEHKNIEELKDVQYFYSAILSNNKAALNSLLKQNSDVVYQLISPYYSCNVLGKIPIIDKVFKNTFKVQKALPKDKQALLHFLNQCNKKKLLGYPFGEKVLEQELELNFRTRQWPDLSLQSFLIVKNKAKDIIACTAPLSNNQDRSIWVKKLSSVHKTLHKSIKIFKKTEIKENQELKILYLTSLEFCPSLTEKDQENIFISFLNYIYSTNIMESHHLLQFLVWNNQNFAKKLLLKSYIHQNILGYFCRVSHKDEALKTELLKKTTQSQIGFELFTA